VLAVYFIHGPILALWSVDCQKTALDGVNGQHRCSVVEIGWVEGKRKRKVIYGKTRKEVAEKLKVILRDQQQGLPVALDHRQTVGVFLDNWLDDTARHTLEVSTYEGYGRRIKIDIKPQIGHLILSKITPQDLSRMYSALLAKGQSNRTVQYDHAVLHRALDQAVRWNLIARNPADMVDAPHPEDREIHPLSEEQSGQLLRAAVGDRLQALYVLALATGMRQGELLGLSWSDVNWDQGALHVRQQAMRTKGKGLALSSPKTARSRRTITIPAAVFDVLRAHRGRQLFEKQRGGRAWENNDLVFPNVKGKLLERPNLLRRSFKPLLERAGLPNIRFHDLRHTHATLLLSKGVNPKVVQERLGHATVSITLDVYAHVIPSMQQDATDKLNSLFG